MGFDEPQLANALSSDNRNAVLTAFMELFTRSLRPTVAVFEDVHWADTATLDLLTSLARRIDRTHAVLVMTFRGRVAPDHPLKVMLGDLPHRSVDNLELEPLSRTAVAHLAGDENLAARIWEQSKGNPFLVSELVNSPGGGVPTSVIDAIGSRLARLPATEQRLVKLVSVVPGRTELVLLDEIDPALREAVHGPILVHLLDLTSDALVFRHELARTAVESALLEPARRELHTQVLAASEKLGLDPARLAHHARFSGDAGAIVRLLPRAARQAAERRNHREAVTLLAALEPHLHLVPMDERADLYQLWATEAEFAAGGGLQHALAAVELRRRLGDTAGLGAALIRASRSASSESDFAHATRLVEEAVQVLDDVGGEELALAHAHMARVALQNSDWETALRRAEKTLALAPEPSRARVLDLAAVGVVGNITAYPSGSDRLEEAAAMAEALGLAWELQRARANLIELALISKDLRSARRLNEMARAMIDDDLAKAQWHAMIGAAIDTAAGDYTAAESALREVIEEPAERASRWFGEARWAELLVRRGQPDAGPAVVRVRDLPHGGRPTVLVWIRRRFSCRHCGERQVESHPEISGKVTRRLARQLVRDAKVMTIKAVADRYGVSWWLVMRTVKAWSGQLETQRRRRRCRVLLVDETSLRRRHRYVTVISDGETGAVLGVVRHRDSKALGRFLDARGPQWRRHVRVVVSDGSKAYQAAIQEWLPGASHVLDRFHVTDGSPDGSSRCDAASSVSATKAPDPPSTPRSSAPGISR